MDTPQLTSAHLESDWHGADAVLGLAEDGGFWAIGLRGGIDPDAVFAGIPMSTSRTGAAQLARLHDLGLDVRLLSPLRDVDTPDDAAEVARAHPGLRFSRLHDALVSVPSPSAQVFDAAYDRCPVTARADDATDPLRLDLARWLGAADRVDALVLTRCRPPVLDLGCGPGRLTVALTENGVAALGVDLSARAVATVRDHGAHSLQRDLFDRLPLEGTWGSVVLLDSNVGIGGDLGVLLARCVALAAHGGLIIVEVDPEATACSAQLVELSSGGHRVVVPWGTYGARAVTAAAHRLDLVVAEEWSAEGRTFVSLHRP
jgi:SAM-dependent methyltransferase